MTDQYAHLPYDARMLKLIGPLRAAFRPLNRRLTVPLVTSGLGPLLS